MSIKEWKTAVKSRALWPDACAYPFEREHDRKERERRRRLRSEFVASYFGGHCPEKIYGSKRWRMDLSLSASVWLQRIVYVCVRICAPKPEKRCLTRISNTPVQGRRDRCMMDLQPSSRHLPAELPPHLSSKAVILDCMCCMDLIVSRPAFSRRRYSTASPITEKL